MPDLAPLSVEQIAFFKTHGYLSHGGSMNVNSTPRCGLFARWGHLRGNEKDFRYEIPDDLWKYWAI